MTWSQRRLRAEIALTLGHKAEEMLKGTVSEVSLEHTPASIDADGRGGFGSSLIFEELGLRYLGPIDGHNLALVTETLEFAKTCDKPIVIHMLTKKGKGFEADRKSVV